MLQRPKFKDSFHVELLESDHVFLLREDSYKVLSGAKYKQLAALLDGTRTAVDLTLALGCRLGDEARFRARQVLVCTSLETHKAIELPADVRDAMKRFEAGQQETQR